MSDIQKNANRDDKIFLALDSNMVRALAELDDERRKHEGNAFDFKESQSFFIKNHGGYLWAIYKAIVDGEIKPVIVDPVYREVAFNKEYLNFMIDFCYFPKNFLNLDDKSYKTVRELASLYTSDVELLVYNDKSKQYEKRIFESPMKKNFNAFANEYTYNNDSVIFAYCGLYNVCLLTADAHGFFGKGEGGPIAKVLKYLNQNNDFYKNDARPINFFKFGPTLKNIRNIEVSKPSAEFYRGLDIESYLRTKAEKKTANRSVPVACLKNKVNPCKLVSKQSQKEKVETEKIKM